MEAAIHIEQYNPAWAVSFLDERAAIARAIEPWLAGTIEHVGSTAVPGLAAKPVVDIMAPVQGLDESVPALERLREIGYCYAPYRSDVMHWLCKPSPELRTHHLHLVPFGSSLWVERLAFRDLLRSNAVVANQYAALKYRLAQTHGNDRNLYTDAKEPFIESALRTSTLPP